MNNKQRLLVIVALIVVGAVLASLVLEWDTWGVQPVFPRLVGPKGLWIRYEYRGIVGLLAGVVVPLCLFATSGFLALGTQWRLPGFLASGTRWQLPAFHNMPTVFILGAVAITLIGIALFGVFLAEKHRLEQQQAECEYWSGHLAAGQNKNWHKLDPPDDVKYMYMGPEMEKNGPIFFNTDTCTFETFSGDISGEAVSRIRPR